MYKRTSRTAHKQTFNPEPLRRCWKECLEKSSFSARKLAAEEFNKKNSWKKRGLPRSPWNLQLGCPQPLQSGEVKAGVSGRETWLSLTIMCEEGWPPPGRKRNWALSYSRKHSGFRQTLETTGVGADLGQCSPRDLRNNQQIKSSSGG